MTSSRRLLPILLIGVLLIGLADAMVGPYLVLFGANEAHLSPFAIGVFVSVTAISGMALSTWLGARYDRSPSRRPALLAVLAPAAGYTLLTTTTSYPLLLVIAATLLGAGAAAFPQLFALARDRMGEGRAGGAPALRSMWSLAWAIGPLIGGVLLSGHGFAGLFLATAFVFALVAVPLAALGRTPPAHPPPAAPEPGPSRSLGVLAVSLALFYTAMFAGSIVLPLFVTKALDRPAGDVGLLFSACAIVEIPAALALMWMPRRASKELAILAGMVLLVVYFVLVATTSSLPVLVAAQAARGVAIAVVSALGIAYFQELLPGAAGRATTLVANTAAAGALVAGILAGAAAQLLGYRAAQVLCGALALAACLLLMVGRGRVRTVTG